jgi:hypothetical protein
VVSTPHALTEKFRRVWGEPVQLVPDGEVPNAIREQKNNPWTVMTPPYGGSEGSSDVVA